MKTKNKVIIIGRPNVGKSCLFNRLLGERQAIVEPSSGVTRDRLYGYISWGNKEFMLVDTGGVTIKDKSQMASAILTQAEMALKDSKLILFVVDSKTGLNACDYEVLDFIRSYNKKIVMVVNKVDNMAKMETLSDFYETGIQDICFVSALHGLNIDELFDFIVKDLGIAEANNCEDDKALKIALIGRPNVGKSSFLNKLLKEERVIVSNQPGTTRDSIDTSLSLGSQKYIMIDTAGLRRKKKQQETIDVYSRTRTIQAIKRSDVCVLLLDALAGICRDDMHIFNLINEEEKCCVIAINKCDLVKLNLKDCINALEQKAAFMSFAFFEICSAKQGKNLDRVLRLAQHAVLNSERKIKQRQLALLLESIVAHFKKQASYTKLKLDFLTQLKIKPPIFALVVNRPELVKDSLLRFIEKRIRANYDFQGTPIKILIKKKRGNKK